MNFPQRRKGEEVQTWMNSSVCVNDRRLKLTSLIISALFSVHCYQCLEQVLPLSGFFRLHQVELVTLGFFIELLFSRRGIGIRFLL